MSSDRKLIAWLFVLVIGLAGFEVYQTVREPNLPHKSSFHVIDDTPKPKPRREGDPETLPSGFIRNINWRDRMIAFESDNGYTRVLGPVCKNPDMLPVWEGEHVYQINFRWIPRYYEGDEYRGQCYVLDWVGHDAAGDLHNAQKPAPVGASGVSK